MAHDKIKSSEIHIRKKWGLDPTTKVEKSQKEYNRADYKRELKRQLEELEDDGKDFDL